VKTLQTPFEMVERETGVVVEEAWALGKTWAVVDDHAAKMML
jgi:hypothetical protein